MPQGLSRDEFYRWAEAQPGRYERIDGQPVAMSPERIQHVRVKARVWAALDRAIAAAGVDCEALSDGVTIEIDDDTDYEPDAVVNCGPLAPEEAVAAPQPLVVVEVLAQRTESIDMSAKLIDYFRVPSIQHYLIVSTRRREVLHHHRDGEAIASRIVNEGALQLDPPGISVDIGEFYAAVR